LAAACHSPGGAASNAPAFLEIGKRYNIVFQRSSAVWDVRVEDIDDDAGWVRVRRVDNFATWWVNIAALERVN